ncbi:unnamed protein product [Discosporangium mesarthrocarpum]
MWRREGRWKGEEYMMQGLWHMLPTNDAGIVLGSSESLKAMITVRVRVRDLAEPRRRRWRPCIRTINRVPKYQQMVTFVYPGGAISTDANLTIKVQPWVGRGCAYFTKCSQELFDWKSVVPFALKIQILKAEVLKALLYGSATRIPRKKHLNQFTTATVASLSSCVRLEGVDCLLSYQVTLTKYRM